MNGHASEWRRGRSRSIGLLAASLLVAACSTAGDGSVAPPPSAPAGGAVIVAQDQRFDRSRLDLPAGVAVPLLFENRDAPLHNVAILDPNGASLFAGEIFGGAGARTYMVPALAAGPYTFRCDVHPDMHGTVVLGAAAADS